MKRKPRSSVEAGWFCFWVGYRILLFLSPGQDDLEVCLLEEEDGDICSNHDDRESVLRPLPSIMLGYESADEKSNCRP
jgi:hypothetical protein